MDKTFVEAIVENAKPIIKEGPNGIEFSNKEFFAIMSPSPKPLAVHSLSGIAGYCNQFLPKDASLDNSILVIEGPSQVSLYSQLNNQTRQRECLIMAILQRDSFPFGVKLPVEKFVISMQASFVQDSTTAAILKMLGRMKSGTEQLTEDDGVTQTIAIKKGIVKEAWASVPNPVTLAPHRTFSEILQPASKFVLRVDSDGPSVSLHEADGGSWKDEATVSIQKYLTDTVSNAMVQVIG